MNVNVNYLKEIYGGASSISAAMVSAIVKCVTLALSVGQMVGSALKRAKNKNYCN